MIGSFLIRALVTISVVSGIAMSSSAPGDAALVPARVARTVTVSVAAYEGNPPGPCTSHCDAIRVRIAGFKAKKTYGYTTNIVASDGSGVVSGTIRTNASGAARKTVAYYDRTVYDETYCVTVRRRQACVQGR